MPRFPAAFAGGYTGIGSLPHRVPAEAIGLALFADVPYWPQLPQRHADEAMVRQFATPGNPLLPDRTAGIWALAEALGDRRLPALKGQITGPVSAGGAPDTWTTTGKALAGKAAWQVRLLRRWAEEVLLVVDEPALATVDEADRPMAEAALRAVITAAREAGATVGVHCCGTADWEWLVGLDWDVLSFDMAIGPPLGLLARHVQAGGGILWGCLPTDQDPDVAAAERQLALRWQAGALDRDMWLRAAMISPACGLGLVPLVRAERICHALAGMTATWRDGHRPWLPAVSRTAVEG